MSFFTKLWDLLFPRVCFLCEREGLLLCAACEATLPMSAWWYCPVCRRRVPDFRVCASCARRSRLLALGATFPYDDPRVRSLIHSFKYDAIQPLAGPLGLLLARYLKASGILESTALSEPLLVAVPLHPRKHRWRGFNQAELLAKIVGNIFGILVVRDALVRTEARKSQVELRDAKDRRENVKGAFALGTHADLMKGRDVLLVDDVVTSGATMEECARMLKKAKARRVFALALAHG